MRTALVIGNGFTKSLTAHCGLALDTSKPLSWPVLSPGKGSLLLDDLPHLKEFMVGHPGCTDDFELFRLMLRAVALTSDSPLPPPEEEAAVLDSGHLLALAFSYFQLLLDQQELAKWPLLEWLRKPERTITAVLSWNYDLAIELSLARTGTPYHYAGIPTPCELAQVNYARTAVTVCKPHGSCNFTPDLRLQVLDEAGAPLRPAYPRQIHATAADAPVRVLRRAELLTVRAIADLVLPGEVNRFKRHLGWVSTALSRFARELSSVEHLVVIGFRMMDCDREEFLAALADHPVFPQITVVDPAPNPLLLEVLATRCEQQLEIVTAGVPA